MKRNRLFSIPYVGWMALFVVAPIVLVVLYAFTTADGGITLSNFTRMTSYIGVFLRSFWLAFLATAICLLLGYPIAYLISRERPRVQRVCMALVMLPMWMNFLLRTYAWMSILENTGLLNRFFDAIGLFDLINGLFGTEIEYFKMINTQGAVVLGITVRGREEALKQETDYQFCVPDITDFMLPSLSILPLQLFAYYVASMKGCDIDKPRNLAKSVTVE